mmetsp:Transcript_32068/g.42758  ORF Transcript_32068/g.42758 Transcript_32068/m.42758 type:complete len:220 (-) Transcript_32068:540-1199(-)
MLKKTLTTKTFSGIPNKFIITERCESGTYFERSVPMEGKYMPTHVSKAKNAATRGRRGVAWVLVEKKDAMPMEIVATIIIRLVEPSVDILEGEDANLPKSVDPSRQLAIKQEKTVPYGVLAPSPNIADTAREMAGGHCRTKMYIAASKRLCTPPTSAILTSPLITSTASRIVGFVSGEDDSATFSFQRIDVSIPPSTRKRTESSNGPVGPREEAAREAN